MQFINLTPHKLMIHREGGSILELNPSGTVARIDTVSTPMPSFDGISVCQTEYGEISGLPEPALDTYYVGSGMVESKTIRSAVLSPGALVRDEHGKPIGCRGLKQTRPNFILAEMDFSKRVLRLLAEQGLYTTDQVICLSAAELLSGRGLGPVSIKEIEFLLGEKEISLKPDNNNGE